MLPFWKRNELISCVINHIYLCNRIYRYTLLFRVWIDALWIKKKKVFNIIRITDVKNVTSLCSVFQWSFSCVTRILVLSYSDYRARDISLNKRWRMERCRGFIEVCAIDIVIKDESIIKLMKEMKMTRVDAWWKKHNFIGACLIHIYSFVLFYFSPKYAKLERFSLKYRSRALNYENKSRKKRREGEEREREIEDELAEYFSVVCKFIIRRIYMYIYSRSIWLAREAYWKRHEEG